MGRFAVYRQTVQFDRFRKVISNIHKEPLEYPCEGCIVDACCTTACEKFEMWLNQPKKETEWKRGGK